MHKYTGPDDDETLGGYDGHLKDQDETSSTENGIDSSQDWSIDITSVDSDNVKISATRARTTDDSDDADFDFPPNLQDYYFAIGTTSNDYTLAYHGSNYVVMNIDLEAGVASVVEEDQFSTEEHALFMYVIYLFVCLFDIFVWILFIFAWSVSCNRIYTVFFGFCS